MEGLYKGSDEVWGCRSAWGQLPQTLGGVAQGTRVADHLWVKGRMLAMFSLLCGLFYQYKMFICKDFAYQGVVKNIVFKDIYGTLRMC